MQDLDQDDLVFVEGVRDLARRVAAWRQSRGERRWMPEELWGEAVEVATELGAYQAARILGLCYRTLKRRLEARLSQGAPESSGPTFVEVLNPMAVGAVVECVLVVEASGGHRVRLELRGITPQGLAALVQGLVA